MAYINGKEILFSPVVNITKEGGSVFKQLIYGTLTEITAEDLQGVTKLRNYAFAFTKLESIVVPNTVTYIGRNAFDECKQLKNIVLPDLVKEINQSTFNACLTLETVTLGSGVTRIGDGAFKECKALKSFTINTVKPPTLSSTAFNYCSSNMIIYVPKESVSAYKAATNWSARADMIIGIGEELPQEPTTNVYYCASDFSGEYVEEYPLFYWQSSLALPDTTEFNATSQCSHCNNTVYMVSGMAAPEYMQVQTCPYCSTYGTLPEPTYH